VLKRQNAAKWHTFELTDSRKSGEKWGVVEKNGAIDLI
jgi:hypothetical protein